MARAGRRGARRRGTGARRGGTPSAGRSRRVRRWARGGAGCAAAGSAARAGGRAGAPAQQYIMLTSFEETLSSTELNQLYSH